MGKEHLAVLGPLGQALQKPACLPTVCQSDLERPHRTSQGLSGPCSTKQEQLLVNYADGR